MALTQEFFAGDTVKVARSLLGKYLVRRYGEVVLAARITETEAYIGRMDKACHAYQYRKTERTKVLFAPPGTVYVENRKAGRLGFCRFSARRRAFRGRLRSFSADRP